MLIAGLAPACGGGDDESPFTQTGVTKPRYIADADAICREAERRLRSASRGLAGRLERGEASARAVEQVARETVIPVVERRIEDLRALEPPPGDEREIDRIYEAAERALERIRRDPRLAERADRVFARASELAAAYGFQDCAEA